MSASSQKTPANAGMGDSKPGMFDKGGAIGKQFTAEGSIGGAAQSVGGPFDKEGAIGKQFTEGGSLGGTVQNNLGGQKHAGS